MFEKFMHNHDAEQRYYYFIRLQDLKKALAEKLFSEDRVVLCGGYWAMVMIADKEHDSYPYPIVAYREGPGDCAPIFEDCMN